MQFNPVHAVSTTTEHYTQKQGVLFACFTGLHYRGQVYTRISLLLLVKPLQRLKKHAIHIFIFYLLHCFSLLQLNSINL